MSSYSIDTLKRGAFVDELENYLNNEKFFGEDARDERWLHVKEYLEQRIKQIDNRHGIEYDVQTGEI